LGWFVLGVRGANELAAKGSRKKGKGGPGCQLDGKFHRWFRGGVGCRDFFEIQRHFETQRHREHGDREEINREE
jgi:hypothetical protein